MKKVSLIFKKIDDPYIQVDSDRLEQVTLNLLSNALKFSKKGGVVELGGEIIIQEDRKFIKIMVKDTGYGIKEEDKPKMFNLFGKLQ
jgi:signal transduction histidine kinase